VKALPGVESATFARMTPLSYGSYLDARCRGWVSTPPEEQPIVEYNEVAPDYFTTLGIPLVPAANLHGRTTKGPLWWPW